MPPPSSGSQAINTKENDNRIFGYPQSNTDNTSNLKTKSPIDPPKDSLYEKTSAFVSANENYDPTDGHHWREVNEEDPGMLIRAQLMNVSCGILLTTSI